MQRLFVWALAGLETSCPSYGVPIRWLAWICAATLATWAHADDRLIGAWIFDDGFQTEEYVFRTDGRYQVETRSTAPGLNFDEVDRGRYVVVGNRLVLEPYYFLGEPAHREFNLSFEANRLVLASVEFEFSQTYEFQPGSRASVLARQAVTKSLVGRWTRQIPFAGTSEYTFRPDGYFVRQDTPEDSQFPPDFVRGRYVVDGAQLTLRPYSGVASEYEVDFFGQTLTLIQRGEFRGDSLSFEVVVGSAAEVEARTAEAAAFLARDGWQVGVWEIGEPGSRVELAFRPDGHYRATNEVEILRGVVRGWYELGPRRLHFAPYVGQGIYSPDNGNFGKVERTYDLDYYAGVLQIIDPTAISQSVKLARQRPGTQADLLAKTHAAELEQAREGWWVGRWMVSDPVGWMEFTLRPDERYLVQAGSGNQASQVERGRLLFRDGKLTLAPYDGLGAARGFAWDYFDGDLTLAGDANRLVIARKQPASEADVREKTLHPTALLGERGPILGRWTAHRPGESVELVFRPDGQFRRQRCASQHLSEDYGLFLADVATRRLTYDSRFVAAQSPGLDYYGNTLTLFGGGFGAPESYTVNLGTVDAAIQDSLTADGAKEAIDTQWLGRVPIGPRQPNAGPVAGGGLPADPRPDRVQGAATAFSSYRLYRRLIPTFVYFDVLGTIKSVPVVNTREWHFFANGRVLVRFKTYRASFPFPNTVADVSDHWGTYQIDAAPTATDILHLYADNTLWLESDAGERAEMTLEDGRRSLFWGKEQLLLQDWATEQQPVPCELPAQEDASLLNTGVSLTTDIEPDAIPEREALQIQLVRLANGGLVLRGEAVIAAEVVVERATLGGAVSQWQPVLTNRLSVGRFEFPVPRSDSTATAFRIRGR